MSACLLHLAKIYSGERFVSSPPQWAWICSGCGERGTEALRAPPAFDMPAYVDTVGKYHLGDAEVFRRMVAKIGGRR